MSKLYFSEKGHVVPSLCEELTSFRHVRKTLYLPPTAAPGILYLLARPHAEAERPLRLAVNGEEIESIRPGPTGVINGIKPRAGQMCSNPVPTPLSCGPMPGPWTPGLWGWRPATNYRTVP